VFKAKGLYKVLNLSNTYKKKVGKETVAMTYVTCLNHNVVKTS
jgi:hypothetical protein